MVSEDRFLKALGEHVGKVRRSKGYSQDRLCLEGSFSRGTLSKIERGLVSPHAYTLAKIANILGVPLRRLVDFELS
jgi:transcriptional regulator with XRE-family HTH domain